MCGIAGYIGSREAVPIVMDQLKRLEYRGYDSAGVAALDGDVTIVKSEGKLRSLQDLLSVDSPSGSVAIAHTRWATHGGPTTRNAHPHADQLGRIVVAHNGIIENYADLRRSLMDDGCTFASETDTEVLPHLIRRHYQGCIVTALREALRRVRGSYALTVVCADEPDLILAARHDSPLVIGLAEGESFLASDIPALLPYTRSVLILEDGDLALIRRGSVSLIRTADGSPIHRDPVQVDWDATSAEKGGFEHFMLKEIFEQPETLRNALRGRWTDAGLNLTETGLAAAAAAAIRRIYLVGCGTAYHAGLVVASTWERRLRVPVTVEVASEFRYREPAIDDTTLVVLISQSGETADTLAALRLASAAGARTQAVVNVVGSTLSREADGVLYTQAGPEICVASTKAYTAQVASLSLLGLWLAELRGQIGDAELHRIGDALQVLPSQVAELLQQAPAIEAAAAELERFHDFFFVGRGLDYAVAQEGALKLKEISYRHSEALAAGEMKHGTLALVTPEVVAIAVATQEALREKLQSNIREVTARGAQIFGVVPPDCGELAELCRWRIEVPRTEPELAPVLAIVPLQLLAYYVARIAGCEIDQPRNLAKSVTVE